MGTTIQARTTRGKAAMAITEPLSAGDPSARAQVWRLEASGWTEREAANVVALAYGLRPAHDGWAIREIEHLRFLRSLVRAGRIVS